MCTVTYVPTAKGFVFTSNRDEDPQRAASQIVTQVSSGEKISFPQDEGAKGSWFAFSSTKFACLLNGAFQPHKRKSSYSMSRGKMVLDFFNYDSIAAFTAAFPFEGMEPFTFIVFNRGDFWVLRWDEVQLHQEKRSPDVPYLWSSRTLYTDDWWEKRNEKFKAFVEKTNPNQAEIISYHQSELLFSKQALAARLGRSDLPDEIPVQTTSTSSIEQTEEDLRFRFLRTEGTFIDERLHK